MAGLVASLLGGELSKCTVGLGFDRSRRGEGLGALIRRAGRRCWDEAIQVSQLGDANGFLNNTYCLLILLIF